MLFIHVLNFYKQETLKYFSCRIGGKPGGGDSGEYNGEQHMKSEWKAGREDGIRALIKAAAQTILFL